MRFSFAPNFLRIFCVVKVTPPAGSPSKNAADLELDLDNLNLDDVQVDPSDLDLEEDLLGDD